jgi:hypothetical protein
MAAAKVRAMALGPLDASGVSEGSGDVELGGQNGAMEEALRLEAAKISQSLERDKITQSEEQAKANLILSPLGATFGVSVNVSMAASSHAFTSAVHRWCLCVCKL